MNHYTQILKYIKELAESDPLVNKVTQGESDKKMFDKITLFPLVHIYVGDFSFGEEMRTVIWEVDLVALKQRNNTNEKTTDNFYLNTNEVDNFNETSAIINRLVSRINSDLSKTKIKLSVSKTAGKLDEFYGSSKDGYGIGLSLELPNNIVNLCQYPIV